MEKVCEFGGHSADVLRLSFARAAPGDEDRAASLSEDGVIKVWTVGSVGVTENYSTRTRGGFALSPSGQRLAWVGEDGDVYVREELARKEKISRYHFDTGHLIQPQESEHFLEHYAEWCHAVAWSRTGEHLFTAASVLSRNSGPFVSGELKKWEVSTGRL